MTENTKAVEHSPRCMSRLKMTAADFCPCNCGAAAQPAVPEGVPVWVMDGLRNMRAVAASRAEGSFELAALQDGTDAIKWIDSRRTPQPAAQESVMTLEMWRNAYHGARQDLAIWKRRAIDAEAKLREQPDTAQGERGAVAWVSNASLDMVRKGHDLTASLWSQPISAPCSALYLHPTTPTGDQNARAVEPFGWWLTDCNGIGRFTRTSAPSDLDAYRTTPGYAATPLYTTPPAPVAQVGDGVQS